MPVYKKYSIFLIRQSISIFFHSGGQKVSIDLEAIFINTYTSTLLIYKT